MQEKKIKGIKRILKVIFLFTFFCSLHVKAQKVNISIFNEKPLKSIVVSAMKGSYRLIADSSNLITLKSNDAIYLSMFDGSILLRNSALNLGHFNTIRFESLDSAGVIKVKPVEPSLDAGQYNDNIIVSIAFKRLLVINFVDPDNYIAGVVEAETGSGAAIELYKAQAALARTYLYGHIKKHESEGFQLCDGVHCQAYHGRVTNNYSIIKATKATSGLVVVDKDSVFITAAFHSNCGGFTESAENAWLIDKSYLVPVKDPFCQKSPQARWTVTMPIMKWRIYLKSHGFKNTANEPFIHFNFVQTERKPYYKVHNDSIPFKQIRSDFNLKSGFFSVSATNTDITLKGRGYGHGVGMCQEGAIYMAKVGYKYDEILKFYFKGIRIVDIKKINFPKTTINPEEYPE